MSYNHNVVVERDVYSVVCFMQVTHQFIVARYMMFEDDDKRKLKFITWAMYEMLRNTN